MSIVKDVEPEILTLTLDVEIQTLQASWRGAAIPVSDAFDDGCLYSQVRCLFNLDDGCVIWMVNHIKLPSGNKMSADKLAWIPNINGKENKLITL